MERLYAEMAKLDPPRVWSPAEPRVARFTPNGITHVHPSAWDKATTDELARMIARLATGVWNKEDDDDG
jgi:hypothetical protein